MTRLHNRGHTVDLQVLDNKASATITQTWKATYQLVPPNMHQQNDAERGIRTFKDHFLAILASVDPAFPKSRWDLLIPHAELTLNLLCQATVTPTAWEYFNRRFDFSAMPLAPAGCRAIFHAKPGTCRYWDFHGKDRFYIGPALHHYQCFHLLKADTGHTMFSDTIKFRHNFLTTAAPSADDCLLHALHTLMAALSDALHSSSDHQLMAIADLKDLFQQWRHKAQLPRVESTLLPMPLPHLRAPSPASHDPAPRELTPAPTVQPAAPPPRVRTMPASNPAPWIMVPTRRRTLRSSVPAPIAQRTRSHTQANHYVALADNAPLLSSPAALPGPPTEHAGGI